MPQIKNTQTGFVATNAPDNWSVAGSGYDPNIWKLDSTASASPIVDTKAVTPAILKDNSSDVVGGSSGIKSQADALSAYQAANVSGGTTTGGQVDPAITALNAKGASIDTTTSTEDATIKQAGINTAAQYQSLIDAATKAKGKGLGLSEVSAGEAGGFMNTQMVGAAAEPGVSGARALEMGRYGTGGELARIQSEYDANINNLQTQKVAAVAAAESAAREAIRTGKQSSFDNAYKMYEAAKAADKAAQDAANAKVDNMVKIGNYQLAVDKFSYDQYNDSVKNDLDSKKLDVSIAGITGMWNGKQTLDAKKASVDELYKKMGYDLDTKKFNWNMSQDEIKADLEQKKYDLEKSKVDAANQGVNINQSVADTLNGLPGLKAGDPGYQAYKAKLNAVSTMLKTESNTTKNPYFDIKSSAANTGSLTSTSQENLAKMLSVMNNLEGVKATFDKLKKDGKLGVVMGNLAKQNFADPDVVTFKAQIAGLIPTVARGVYGEVGVLTDNDMATYAKTIMNMGNPESAGDAIYTNLFSTIKNKIGSDLKSAVNNGKNVSGYANDYLNIVSSINKMTGDKFTPSVNEAAFDHWDQFSAQLGGQMSQEWINNHADMMANAGIGADQLEDYFQFVKEQKLDSDIYKDVEAANNAKESSFNNVGSDTNKATSKIIDTKIGGKTIKVSESISDKIAKADADYFKDTGNHLQINQSFRTKAQQEKLYKELKPKGAQVAKPGTSFHEKGMAIDVTNWKEAEKYLNKYGLKNDLKNDKGHFSLGEFV